MEKVLRETQEVERRLKTDGDRDLDKQNRKRETGLVVERFLTLVLNIVSNEVYGPCHCPGVFHGSSVSPLSSPLRRNKVVNNLWRRKFRERRNLGVLQGTSVKTM